MTSGTSPAQYKNTALIEGLSIIVRTVYRITVRIRVRVRIRIRVRIR